VKCLEEFPWGSQEDKKIWKESSKTGNLREWTASLQLDTFSNFSGRRTMEVWRKVHPKPKIENEERLPSGKW